MERYYSFAGVDICVELPDGKVCAEEKQLEHFQTPAAEATHRFFFSMAPTLAPPAGIPVEGERQIWINGEAIVRYTGDPGTPYMRAEHRGKMHYVQLRETDFPQYIGTKTILNALFAEHLVVEAGGVILHCSYIDHKGKGILFTAPSGTGKSTQAELWHSLRDADIINGDRAAMRFWEGEALAMGIPFCGSSTYCNNRTLPLRAIVYLGQAPETTIRKLKGFEAFRRIWEGCSVNSWYREDMARASETVMNILAQVPVFELYCTPDESAVIALEKVLQEV